MDKKRIKEFLKPNKKKLLVFVTLGIILLFIPMIPCAIYYYSHSMPAGINRGENLLCSPSKCILDLLPRYDGGITKCSWNLILLVYISVYLFSCAISGTKK